MSNNVPVVAENQPIWTEEDKRLIQETVARGTNESEFKLFLYTAAKYGLDPLLRQVWCVKYPNNPASIFTGRDGFLSIAHRSGKFDGMESGTKIVDGEVIGWCRVYRTDMSHPFYVEVRLSEYNTGKNLWNSKPHTMIQKVAESQCLRRAFDISGLYAPEEMAMAQDEMYVEEVKINDNVSVKTPISGVITDTQKRKISVMMSELGLDAEFMQRVTEDKFGKQSSKELTKKEADTLIEFLKNIKNGKAVWPGEEEQNSIQKVGQEG